MTSEMSVVTNQKVVVKENQTKLSNISQNENIISTIGAKPKQEMAAFEGISRVCHICNKHCETKELLNKHILTHSAIISQIVDALGTSIPVNDLTGRSTDVIAEMTNKDDSSRTSDVFVEPVCAQDSNFGTFQVKENLAEDINVENKSNETYHHDEQTKEILQPTHTANELYLGKKIKSFVCTVCGQKSRDAYNLKVHMRIHTEEQPYSCPVCHKSFRVVGNRNKHIRNVHKSDNLAEVLPLPDDPIKAKNRNSYECTVCGLRCASLTNLTVHSRIHTGERPYSCSVCNKSFIHKGNLNKHVRNVHKTHHSKDAFCKSEFTDGLEKLSVSKMICVPTDDEFTDGLEELSVSKLDFVTTDDEFTDGLEKLSVSKMNSVTTDDEFTDGPEKLSVSKMNSVTTDDLICDAQPKEVNDTLATRLDKETRSSDERNNIKPKRPCECTVCGLKCAKPCHLEVHMRIHTDEQPYSCPVCHKSFRQAGNLNKHVRNVHKSDNLVEVLPPPDDLDRAKIRNSYECTVCGLRCASLSNLTVHSRIHTDERPYSCSMCNKSFIQKDNLNKHVHDVHKTHYSENVFCKSEFTDGLEKLSVSKMNCVTTDDEFTDGLEKLSISKTFTVKENLAEDINVKNKSKETYPHDNKQTNVANELYAGKNIQTFVCTVCGLKCRFASNLKVHMRIHTDEQPHSCSVCHKSFNQAGNIKRHKHIVHKSDNLVEVLRPPNDLDRAKIRNSYECTVCGLRCSSLTNLTVHSRIHTGERPYSCSLCSKSFIHKGNLNKHVRNVHKTHHSKDAFCKSEFTDGPEKLSVSKMNCVTTDDEFTDGLEKLSVSKMICVTRDDEFTDGLVKLSVSKLNCVRTDNFISDAQPKEVNNTLATRLDKETRSGDERTNTKSKRSCVSKMTSKDFSSRTSDVFVEPVCAQASNFGTFKVKENLAEDINVKNKSDETYHHNEQTKEILQPTHAANELYLGRKIQSFVCTVCGQKCRSASNLKVHMRIHTDERPYSCPVCHKSFRVVSNRNKHIRNVHKMFTEVLPPPDDINRAKIRNSYECTVCGLRCASLINLTVHSRIHTNERPYSCSVCNKSFIQKGNLNEHVRNVHKTDHSEDVFCKSEFTDGLEKLSVSKMDCVTTDDEFTDGLEKLSVSKMICVTTDDEFTDGLEKLSVSKMNSVTTDDFISDAQPKDLATRLDKETRSGDERTHTKCKRQFECTICGRKFAKPCHLEIHMRIHTNQRPYFCPWCNKSFKRISDRNKHVPDAHFTVIWENEFTDELDNFSVSKMNSIMKDLFIDDMPDNKAPNASKPDMNPIILDISQQDMSLLDVMDTNSVDKINIRKRPEEFNETSAEILNIKLADGINNYDKESVCLTAFHLKENKYGEKDMPLPSVEYNNGVSNKDVGSIKDNTQFFIYKQDTVKDKNEQNNARSYFSTQSLLITNKKDSEDKICPTNAIPYTPDHAKLATILIGDGGRKQTYICNVCGLKTINIINFKYHLFTHPREQHFDCLLCKRSFRRKTELTRHIQDVHEGKKKKERKCNICSKLFSRQWQYKRHLMMHSGEKPDPCPICNKYFRGPFDLKSHMKTHENRSYVCEICGKQLRTLGSLHTHSSMHSGDQNNVFCEICGKQFRLLTSLWSHKQIHFGEKDFKCDLCNKSFRTKSGVINHITEVHLDIRKFPCSVCNKSFHTKIKMKKHTLCHSTERPLVCKTCGKTFRQKHIFKSHLFSHTGIKPFSCDLCDGKFTRKQYLKTHMLIHEGKKPHRCSTCGNTFRQKIELKLHIRRHHANTHI